MEEFKKLQKQLTSFKFQRDEAERGVEAGNESFDEEDITYFEEMIGEVQKEIGKNRKQYEKELLERAEEIVNGKTKSQLHESAAKVYRQTLENGLRAVTEGLISQTRRKGRLEEMYHTIQAFNSPPAKLDGDEITRSESTASNSTASEQISESPTDATPTEEEDATGMEEITKSCDDTVIEMPYTLKESSSCCTSKTSFATLANTLSAEDFKKLSCCKKCNYTKSVGRRLLTPEVSCRYPAGVSRRLAAIPVPGLDLQSTPGNQPQVESFEPEVTSESSTPLVTGISAAVCFVGCVLREIYQRTKKSLDKVDPSD